MEAGYDYDKPLGYAQLLAVPITPQSLAAVQFGDSTKQAVGVPFGTQMLLIQPVGQAIRWRDDGVAPSATLGMRVPVGGELEYTGNPAMLQIAAEIAGAEVNISAYG